MHGTTATEAMDMAFAARPRVRANDSYLPVACWSLPVISTTDQKHRPPRRTKASP